MPRAHNPGERIRLGLQGILGLILILPTQISKHNLNGLGNHPEEVPELIEHLVTFTCPMETGPWMGSHILL